MAQHGPNPVSNPDSLHKNRLAWVMGVEAAYLLGGSAALEFIWYRDHARVPFHFYRDGKGWNQLDKAGHLYISYYQSIAGYQALRWAGVPDKQALWYGGLQGLLLQTPVEIFDGLYEGYGFSWSDMIANAGGSALFMSQQALLGKQMLRLKFSYSPSGYPEYHPWYLGDNALESFFQDYNAHTYWLSLNLKGVASKLKLPPWLNLAVGYSANGMLAEFENPSYYLGRDLRHIKRYRQYLLSLDVDFSRIPTRKKWLKALFSGLNMIKVPFPAMEYNRVSGLRFRSLYF